MKMQAKKIIMLCALVCPEWLLPVYARCGYLG